MGKTALFELQPSSENYARFDSVFTSLDSAAIILLDSKFAGLASNPKPGGPGFCLYVSQLQGGSIIPPGTGFPFRRLLRLAGLQWRYSNPTPHGERMNE
jgi:hypothetical protein